MTSSQLLLNFTVDQLKGEGVVVLSVFKDKLLVCSVNRSQLFIYSCEGRDRLSTIIINDTLLDATWTPLGNIVYTTYNSKKVVKVESGSGKCITTHTKMKKPRYFSVSNDGIIYLADEDTGVYQSTNDGVNWSLVFKSALGQHCWQAIKVTTDDCDDFWTREGKDKNSYLRVYTVDKKRSEGGATFQNANVPTTDGKYIDLSGNNSCLSHDGDMNIFLSDYKNKAVHVLSVNRQYHCQLLSSLDINNSPSRLAVDRERQLLYVGQYGGLVGIFKLIYG